MDAALRIKEINAAREKIGADPYLGTDRGIKESFSYGICEELVKDSPDYDKVLLELELAEAERLRIAREKREEEERIAREKREEEERIAREKREEEARIAREKREEAARIAREKREEEERIARAKREEQERIRLQEVEKAQKKRRAAIQKDLGNPGLSVGVWFNADDERLGVRFDCEAIEGYYREIVVQFKNGLSVQTDKNSYYYCNPMTKRSVKYIDLRDDELLSALEEGKDPKSLIAEAYILITGVGNLQPRSRERKVKASNFPPLDSKSRLKDPIRIDLAM